MKDFEMVNCWDGNKNVDVLMVTHEYHEAKIAELEHEVQAKHAKLHEALRLRDVANDRIAELEKERDESIAIIKKAYQDVCLGCRDTKECMG